MDNLLRIHIQIKKHYYKYKRYNVETTFAMLYHEKVLSVVQLSNFLRISDHFIALDNHHYFIVFAHSDENAAYKGSENLLYNIDKEFNNRTTCIAIEKLNINNSPEITINRLMQILDITRKESYLRIENEDILDKYII